MSSQIGILAFGAYIPERRLQRAAVFAAHGWFAGGLKGLAKGERSVANWDEDSITMAVEAARDCLAGIDRTTIAAVTLASTTLPFADRLNAGVVKEALALSDAIVAGDATGSQRAGTTALMQALTGGNSHLVVGADLRKTRPASEAEMIQGDAAAALLVGGGDVVARFLGAYSETIDFVDHFRATDVPFDYNWESRWVRDEGYAKLLAGAIKTALEKFGVAGNMIDKAAIAVSVKGVPESVAKAAGIRPNSICDTLGGVLGDAGTAHPLLMLAAALETAKPGDKILVASFGQGADILLFEATDALARLPKRQGVAGHLARRREDQNYLRFLFHRGLIALERGQRAELDEKQPGTSLYRNRRAVLGLIGGRCTKTGTVQFPKSDIGVNPNDRSQGTQEDYPLAERTAKIVTYTADVLGYSPNPPLYYGTIDFEGGGRLVAEFADCTAEDIEVGREMQMMFRIRSVDERRDFKKYFWKAAPISRGDRS